jgi:hypothetical protein
MPTPLFAWACSPGTVKSCPRNDAVGMPPGFRSNTLSMYGDPPRKPVSSDVVLSGVALIARHMEGHA